MTILDWRDQQQPGGPDPKCGRLDAKGRLFMRDPRTIDGIVIHQTDCHFGAGHRPDRHVRALDVHAHATAFDDGVAVIAYPLRAYVWHGNGLNVRSIGLEVEGKYDGRGKGGEVPDAAVWAACEALKFLVDEAAKEGISIKRIWAHRQSSATRRGDPGGEIWKRVVLGYAVPTLGLVTELNSVTGDGRPVPHDWDANAVGAY